MFLSYNAYSPCGPSLVSRAGDAGSTENKREGA